MLEPSLARRLHLGLLVAVGVTLGVFLVSTVATEAAPSRSDEVVFADAGRIVVATADGARRRVLTDPGDGEDSEPRWSPDGSRIAFQRRDATGNTAIWTVTAQGSDARKLTDGPSDGGLVWSPDGTRIAFANGQGISIVRADGSGERALTTPTEGVVDIQPTWHPAGTRLGFHRIVPPDNPENPEASTDDEVWTVPVRDGEAEPLLASEGVDAWDNPAWSPAGAHLAVDDGHRVHTLRPDGSALAAVAEGEEPAWSPSGDRLAFTHEFSGEAPGGESNIRVVDRDGGNGYAVADVGTRDRRPVWSPGGSRLAFEATDPGTGSGTSEVHAVHADGSQLAALSDSGDARGADVAPGTVVREFGPTRIDTAVHLSQESVERADTVLIARSDRFPDALAAAPRAAQLTAPVLLNPADRLADAVAAEINRLGAATAVLLGGDAALTEEVAAQLRARTGVDQVTRVAGADRFDTARRIAGEVGGSSVLVVEGIDADPARGWPDAVSASAYAALTERPILLVSTDEIPQPTRRAVEELEATEATIVGGPAAVSEDVADELAGMGLTVERLAGDDRYETAKAVAEAALDAGAQASTTWLATGRDWPDALAAGPATQQVDDAPGVLLLVEPADLHRSRATFRWLFGQAGRIERVRTAGGAGAVQPMVRAQAAHTLESAPADDAAFSRSATADPVADDHLFLADAATGRIRPVSSEVNVSSGLSWAPDGSRTVFDSRPRPLSEDRERTLAVSDLAGDLSDLVTESDAPAVTGGAAWSPTGGRLVFTRFDESGDGTLWLVEPDRSGLTQLTDDGDPDTDDVFPTWSPDGTRVAFQRRDGDTTDIHVVRVADAPSPGQRLAGGAHNPAWSPTGDWIALGVIAERTRRMELVRPDGSDRHALANGSDFAWSPDGTRMAFSAGTSNRDLHLIEVDNATGAGSGQRALADVRGRDVAPTWTADGEVMIFHAQVPPEGETDLYAVRATGAGLHALTDGGRSRGPVGRPAG